MVQPRVARKALLLPHALVLHEMLDASVALPGSLAQQLHERLVKHLGEVNQGHKLLDRVMGDALTGGLHGSCHGGGLLLLGLRRVFHGGALDILTLLALGLLFHPGLLRQGNLLRHGLLQVALQLGQLFNGYQALGLALQHLLLICVDGFPRGHLLLDLLRLAQLLLDGAHALGDGHSHRALRLIRHGCCCAAGTLRCMIYPGSSLGCAHRR
mmetsp:Transcript_13616/g.34962  ORF Transcript_13616/g.34962 Transcript_13616/m.34962 type:complete len:212 (+) Transcript_13616:794-1429(+)